MCGARFEKKTTVELLADAIEAQIRLEGWKGLLPSGRDLSRKHQVSLPTAQKAIALLARRGVVISRGGKRRPAVATMAAEGAKPAPRNHVLVMSSSPLTDYDVTIVLGMQRLGEELRARGDGFRIVDLSAVTGAARRKLIRAELTSSAPTHCILMKPDRDMYDLVVRADVKLATMFNQLKVRHPFGLGVRYGYLVDIAFKRLKQLGHRRFFLPFLGRKVRLRSLKEGVLRSAKAHGVEARFVESSAERNPANMAAVLEKALRWGATAILFPQWVDFIPAMGFFAKKGLEFPRDLSVVALLGTAYSRLHVPAVAGCQSSPESIAQQAAAWIASGKVDDDAYRQVYEQTWEDGGSIGPAPR